LGAVDCCPKTDEEHGIRSSKYSVAVFMIKSRNYRRGGTGKQGKSGCSTPPANAIEEMEYQHATVLERL
jgi:hypothetical protein